MNTRSLFLRKLRNGLLSAFILWACGMAAPPASAQIPLHPDVPEAVGVNIHFTTPRPGEMRMLASTGVRWIRMDFTWESTERQKGQYDFAAYDGLMAALEAHRIRAIFILDYGNPLYDRGLAPYSEEGRQAFARWAAAAVRHFRGKGILWEMWNEPNGEFWKPESNVSNYAKLALATGKAIREADANATFIGPAVAGAGPKVLPFLEACFKAGMLKYWSAVSVHPYRHADPETAAPDYRALRQLIAEYAPPGKHIPVIAGEWGYTVASKWNGTDRMQALFLAREWLTDLSNSIPVSIWYDWHDDGPDPHNTEHHFGLVRFPYHPGRRPVYTPKPAYRAARTLAHMLAGYRFEKRLQLGQPDDYALVFRRGQAVRLAVWTTSSSPHTAAIPARTAGFSIISYDGKNAGFRSPAKGEISVTLSDAPQYLVPGRVPASQLGQSW